MARTKPFERPVRRVNEPTIVVLRRFETKYDTKFNPLPVKRVPLEERSGDLTVILSLKGLEISGSETGDVYPQSPAFKSGPGCEIHLEVYQRGRSEEDYERYRRAAGTRIVPMQGVRTPLAISDRAGVYLNGVDRMGGDSLTHMRLLPPNKLVEYLTGALPLLGVAPGDAETVTQRIRSLLLDGRQRLTDLERRLQERR
jgi:hypothetical protein